MGKWDDLILQATGKTTCVTCRCRVVHEKAHLPTARIACCFSCAKSEQDAVVLQGGTAVDVTRPGRRYILCSLNETTFAIFWNNEEIGDN